jgi:fatty-acyl-CoA synthase
MTGGALDHGTPGVSPARIAITGPAALRAIEAAGPDGLLPAWTYHECFRLAAALDPDKPANIFLPNANPATDPRIISYAELLELIEQAANLFHAVSGDHAAVVSVLAPALPEALVAMWAAAIAGACNPINPFLDVAHIAGIMNAARSTVLVTATAASGPGAWQRLAELASAVPSLRAVLVIDAANLSGDDFLTRVRQQPHKLTFKPDPDPDRVSGYFHTGGTTAAPKLVRHTQRGQLLNAWISGAHMGPARDEVVGHGMPNFHVGGAILLCLRALIMGQTLLTLTPSGFRDATLIGTFWDIARRYRMTSVCNAPTSAAMILAQRDTHAAGHSIRTFTTGGGAMPRGLGSAFQERFGVALREIWGMTEFQGILSSNPWGDAPPRTGSVGLLNPFHRVMAARIEDGVFVGECEPGEKGVLTLSGPCMTPGYLNVAGPSSLFVRDMPDGGRWVNSGDLGSVDADGYVWLYGRQKDVIVRGGHNIEPGLVEEVLSRHPAVAIAAAVGQPDALKGELPIAYVQLRAGASATPDELLALCRDDVAERAAVPVEVVIIDAIPVTAVGKIFKPALRLDAMARSVRRMVADSLGADHAVAIDVLETATRPAARLGIPAGADAEQQALLLREAFGGFQFDTVITIG